MSGTNHKLDALATLNFVQSSNAGETSVDWVRVGRASGSLVGSAWVVRFDALTTQARTFKTLGRALFRTGLRARRPDPARAFEVAIRIEAAPGHPRHDVDNVAKAVLDALTGAVFRDDSQVDRLYVERTAGDAARVWAVAVPIDDDA